MKLIDITRGTILREEDIRELKLKERDRFFDGSYVVFGNESIVLEERSLRIIAQRNLDETLYVVEGVYKLPLKLEEK